MRQRTWVCAIALAAVLLCAAVAVHIVRAEAFMAEVGRAAGRIASQQLGTDVQIGAVEIRSLHELAIDDIVIYDKQTEEVLRADRARVTLRLLSLLSSPATSVDEILLTGVHAHLVQREDGSWNYADLVSDDAEPSTFVGRIRIADGTADAVVAGHSYELTDLSGAVDIDRGAFSYDASAQFMGIPLRVRGEKTSDVQDVQLAADDADLTPLLALLPEGALPERVQIRALHADRVRAGLRLVDGTRTMEGRIEGVRADADLYGTQTTLTSAALRFDERALFVAATATAAEQTARVDGTVRLDTDAPYLDLRVRAEHFAPAAVYAESPYTGTVSADVRVTGTMDAPTAAGHVTAEGGTVSNVGVTRADADIAYADGMLSFQNLAAETFGGNISGEGTLSAADLSYAAHLKIAGLPLDRLRTDAQLPLPADLSGTLSADLGIEGQGTERTGLAVYG
ncbi:translocation/assembly module TamB domain-containing protein, partial [Selenomonas sp.]|uniref:translocation/assembly module TamB domain-containing protein n=1 Tax=Selenomonas sp. TaxID=2053611 RepID=UPI001CAF7BB7